VAIKWPDGFKVICEFIAGSHLYGMATEESDIDIRGVFIPSRDYFYGLENVRDITDSESDTEYKEIRTFVSLAMNSNPNIIEYLFVPYDLLRVNEVKWMKIAEHREHFVSQKCKHTFYGYARSQMKRIRTHRHWLLNPPKKKPERSDFGLPDLKMIPGDQIGAFNKLVSMYMRQTGKFHKLADELEKMEEFHSYEDLISNLQNKDYNAIKTLIPVSDNFLEVLAKEQSYTQALHQWKQYQKWLKVRNPARAALEAKYGYDTKHASHLFRLVYECYELIQTGKITFPRHDAAQLLEIRNGSLTYEEIEDRFETFDFELSLLLKDKCVLPRSPNHKVINKLCVEICEEYLTGSSS
jgi:hypothetical protein